MTIDETMKEAKKIFQDNQIEDSGLIVHQLLCKVLNQDRQYLLVHHLDRIEQNQYQKTMELVQKIIQGEPLQYLIGHQEFMGHDFLVNHDVLIPQPDTEIVVENCFNICQEIFNKKKELSVLDLCTGTGAIAISLEKQLPNDEKIKIYGSDLSAEALQVANQNKELHQSAVTLIQSDLFQNIDQSFDVIVSNPPYIETDIIPTLSRDVQAEPHIALDGGKDGLKFYRMISKEAWKHLRVGGYLCIEIGYQQAKSVTNLLEENFENIYIKQDLAGQDRCIICQTKGEKTCHFQET